nr:SHOCT domain-containing protein [uncultured Clostridium sp.]
MKNKKKNIIAGSCTIFILVIFLIVINFGFKMGYEKKTRKIADMWFKISVDEDEKPGRLKYLYAMYNKDIDIIEVTYYAKLGNSMIGDSDWLQLSVPLSSDKKLAGEPEAVYCPEYYYEEYMARPDKVKVMEDDRGEWERIDRMKGQGVINGICILALLTISGFILFCSKDDIKNILNKQNKNSSAISDKTLINAESNSTNLNKLKELTLMKENGFITEEEFETKKRDIIDKM